MDAFDRKNRPPPHPLEGLESPFLDQELFAGQGEEEWEPRLGALEAASPFLGTFGLPGAGALPPAAEREEESPFPEATAEAGFEGLFEAEGGITGEDDRTEVRDTTIAPYRWICSVTYEKDGKTLDGGSGLLISDRHVLTAAHVITEAGSGPSAPSLYVYPGRHYGGEPFGKFLAAKTRVPNFRMDFGLITLSRPVDPSLLWWGHPSTNTVWWSEALIPFQELRQRELAITTAGYPGAKDAYRRRMYEAKGVTVAATFGGSFRHTADTTQGQSGSPLWTERGGRRILIGIVRAFDRLPNQIAVFAHDRIVRGLVERWMAEDAPRPRPVQRRIALEIPYRWICRLEVYDNDLRRVVGYGTGLLISDRHVLTSARVIHGFSRDRRRYAVRIAPGYEFGKEAFGSVTASRARVSPKFSPGSTDASADYGVLTLSRAVGGATFPAIQNAALGSWGGANHGLVTSAADWSGKQARLAAFSRASGGGGGDHALRVSSGGIVGLKGGQILHRAGSKLDAPGAPIWVEGGGRRVLIGIASSIFSKESGVNWGCYLGQETLSHLREWLNEDFEQKELEAGEHFSPDELESFPASPGDEAEAWADETHHDPQLEDGFREAGSQADDFLGPAEFAAQEQEEASGVETEAYEEETLAEPEESRELCYEEETPYEEAELEEEEFRVNRLPAKARQHFAKGGASWRDAVAEAMGAGIRNPNDLADIIFFMQHPERMSSGVGKPISKNDPEFFKLRAEWELCRTIAKRRLTPSAPCPVFLPAVQSPNYEQYVAAPTTGRITLMLNGRNSGGSGDVDDQTEAYDSMQETVESLGRGDSLFLAAWQLKPTTMDLTRPNPAGLTNWGELFVRKATEGVRIRIIVSDMPPDGVGFKSDVQDLTKLVDKLPAAARDNLKFIVSMHPAKIPDPRKFLLDSVHVATHHQKFMVVKKGNTTIAYCGGLDLSPPRTPKGWAGFLVWHDIHGKLEGRITGDLEREFILRWNREKDKSTEPRHPGWKTLESLTQAPMGAADTDSRTNTHRVQMLRTVSVGALPQDIRRDDIWQGYFRLIGCATRFLFMENQYFFEPKLADAIVKQAEAQPALIVIIVVSFETDDPSNPYTQHGRALQNEFFTRLSAGIPSTRLRVYTMLGRLVHSKLVLVDDQLLTVGSANANPRGFFMDTELNVMLDDADAVKGFRHKLWTHDLGLLPGKAAAWGVPDFIPQWDLVAKFNDKLRKTPGKMVGESVVPFDPRTVKGEKAPYIPDVLSES